MVAMAQSAVFEYDVEKVQEWRIVNVESVSASKRMTMMLSGIEAKVVRR